MDTDDSAEAIARTAQLLRSSRLRLGLDPLLPQLPQWYLESPQRRSPSDSSPETTYDVDIDDLTCTCTDFVGRRAGFPTRDPRRVCKHLYRELSQDGLLSSMGELERVLVESGCHSAELYTAAVSTNHSLVVGFTPGHPWIDVFARTRGRHDRGSHLSGPYKSYGFSVVKRTWSYGDAPVGARELRRLFELSGLSTEAQVPPSPTESDGCIEQADTATDAIVESAAHVVIEHQLGSTSILQRRFGIGYSQASKLIDRLQSIGVLGPADGSKPRDVLIGLEELPNVMARVRHT